MIKISNLSEDLHNFEFENKIEELELKEPFLGNYLVSIELRKLHNQVVLNIVLSTRAVFECDRCGDSYGSNLQNNFQMVYLLGDAPVGDDSDNVVYLPPDADKINLRKELRDYAILSIPMKRLCSEECKGLCYRCGKNLNTGSCDCEAQQVDAKWQPLLELKKKMNFN